MKYIEELKKKKQLKMRRPGRPRFVWSELDLLTTTESSCFVWIFDRTACVKLVTFLSSPVPPLVGSGWTAGLSSLCAPLAPSQSSSITSKSERRTALKERGWRQLLKRRWYSRLTSHHHHYLSLLLTASLSASSFRNSPFDVMIDPSFPMLMSLALHP